MNIYKQNTHKHTDTDDPSTGTYTHITDTYTYAYAYTHAYACTYTRSSVSVRPHLHVNTMYTHAYIQHPATGKIHMGHMDILQRYIRAYIHTEMVDYAATTESQAHHVVAGFDAKRAELRLCDIPLWRMLMLLARQGQGYDLARCSCVCRAWRDAAREVYVCVCVCVCVCVSVCVCVWYVYVLRVYFM